MKGENNHQYGLRGELNSSFKGGMTTKNGYIMIYSPNHPFCDCDGMMREHRLVAEKYLLTSKNSIEIDNALYLKPTYEVHHIDENKKNNSIENLMVLTKSDHVALHNLKDPQPRDICTGRFIKSI